MLRTFVFLLLTASLSAQDMTITQDSFNIDLGGYVDYGDATITNNTSDLIELSIGLEKLCQDEADPTTIQLCLGTICFAPVNVDTIFGATSTNPFGEIEPMGSFNQFKVSTFNTDVLGSKWRVSLYNRNDTTAYVDFIVEMGLCGIVSYKDLTKTTDFSLGPNPATNNLFLDFADTDFQPLEAEIYSANGELVHTQALNGLQSEISVNTLTNGMYILQVRSEEGVVVRRFIKE